MFGKEQLRVDDHTRVTRLVPCKFKTCQVVNGPIRVSVQKSIARFIGWCLIEPPCNRLEKEKGVNIYTTPGLF